ncbi:Rpn family recombination-promoting nuclease/putative transposase, partial [Yersinia enterocolitica]
IAQKLEQKGEARGIVKGRVEGKLDVARTMLANGLDRATVMKMTGLSEEELAQICH